LIGFSYKLTDYYLYVVLLIHFVCIYIYILRLTANNPSKTFNCWPNLVILFDGHKVNRFFLRLKKNDFREFKIRIQKMNFNKNKCNC